MDYLILALATWRISNLLAYESGPFGMFDSLRLRAGVYYDQGRAQGHTWLAKGLICTWCTSVYIGAVWTLLYLVFGEPAVWLALPLALSAAAILFDEFVGLAKVSD